MMRNKMAEDHCEPRQLKGLPVHCPFCDYRDFQPGVTGCRPRLCVPHLGALRCHLSSDMVQLWLVGVWLSPNFPGQNTLFCCHCWLPRYSHLIPFVDVDIQLMVSTTGNNSVCVILLISKHDSCWMDHLLTIPKRQFQWLFSVVILWLRQNQREHVWLQASCR